jgi:hypothetical protein
MAREDWYRSETWDESTRAAFESRLARSRTPFHRAQYLRIQGVTLTATGKRREVNAGRGLLERVIADFPDEVMEVAGAHFALGESLLGDNCVDDAIPHFRVGLIVESGRHFSQGTELRLAEALLAKSPSVESLNEVAQLLDEAAGRVSF